MAKGHKGMGSSRGEMRGAPMHREHQGKDTSNLISLALLQMSSSQLEKVVSFQCTSSPPPQNICRCKKGTFRKAKRGRGEDREEQSRELMLDSC